MIVCSFYLPCSTQLLFATVGSWLYFVHLVIFIYFFSIFSVYFFMSLFTHFTLLLLCLLMSRIMLCDCDLQVGAGGSHRTLLYGQAVLFLHSYSGMVSQLDMMQIWIRRFQSYFTNSFINFFKIFVHMFTEIYIYCSFHPQYLSCLSSSQSSTDKLAFDVGLQEDKAGIFGVGSFF